jgi:hypothetical protein
MPLARRKRPFGVRRLLAPLFAGQIDSDRGQRGLARNATRPVPETLASLERRPEAPRRGAAFRGTNRLGSRAAWVGSKRRTNSAGNVGVASKAFRKWSPALPLFAGQISSDRGQRGLARNAARTVPETLASLQRRPKVAAEVPLFAGQISSDRGQRGLARNAARTVPETLASLERRPKSGRQGAALQIALRPFSSGCWRGGSGDLPASRKSAGNIFPVVHRVLFLD